MHRYADNKELPVKIDLRPLYPPDDRMRLLEAFESSRQPAVDDGMFYGARLLSTQRILDNLAIVVGIVENVTNRPRRHPHRRRRRRSGRRTFFALDLLPVRSSTVSSRM